MAISTIARGRDLTGQRFRHLIVLTKIAGRAQSLCRCDCGNSITVANKKLLNGNNGSCGCMRGKARLTHGKSRLSPCGPSTPEHQAWTGMRQRCYNPNAQRYPRYGARGIIVCARWHDFAMFLADMGPRPEGMTLDRKNNNGNYEPDNCRWATRKQQQRNHSRNIILSYNGESMTIIEWSEALGLNAGTLSGRFHKGWSHERILTTRPIKTGRPPRAATQRPGTDNRAPSDAQT